MSSIKISKEDVSKIVAREAQAHYNVGLAYVVTTQDKIQICLMKYLQDMGARDRWQAPFGMILTIGLVFLTADFKQFIFSKETWQAVFIIALLFSAAWLVNSLFHRKKAKTIEEVIDELKHGVQEVQVVESLNKYLVTYHDGK